MTTTQNYPSDGARVLAETGKTKSQIVFEEEFPEGLPAEDKARIGLAANSMMNSGPGWLPSAAMRRACRNFKAQVWKPPVRVRSKYDDEYKIDGLTHYEINGPYDIELVCGVCGEPWPCIDVRDWVTEY